MTGAKQQLTLKQDVVEVGVLPGSWSRSSQSSLKDICACERFPHENVPGESLTDPSRGISSLGMWPRKGSKEGQPDTESSVGSAYSQGLWFSRHLVGKLPNNRTVHTLRDETPEETR